MQTHLAFIIRQLYVYIYMYTRACIHTQSLSERARNLPISEIRPFNVLASIQQTQVYMHICARTHAAYICKMERASPSIACMYINDYVYI